MCSLFEIVMNAASSALSLSPSLRCPALKVPLQNNRWFMAMRFMTAVGSLVFIYLVDSYRTFAKLHRTLLPSCSAT